MKTRFRLAFLVGGSVVLALLLTLLIFNVGTRRMIRSQAEAAIRQAMQQDGGPPDKDRNTDSSAGSVYSAEIFTIPRDLTEQEQYLWYTESERNLISYYEEQKPEKETIIRCKAGSRTYYFAAYDGRSASGDRSSSGSDPDDFSPEKNGRLQPDGTFIAYVDITGLPEMTARIDLYVLIAAALIALFGSFLGYKIGKRLEENESSKQHFFENTSHELKTPLAVIRGYAEGISTGVIPDHAKAGKIISKQAEKMSSLVEDILLISRMEGGSEPLRKQETDVKELLEDCLMPLEDLVKRKGLAVELDLESLKVQADPDRLGHAVTNLLSNAVKYAKTTIRIRLKNGQLMIQNDTENLTKEDVSHMFERFYTGPSGSTGIGLALAREIIDLHGFRIRAEGEENTLTVTVDFL